MLSGAEVMCLTETLPNFNVCPKEGTHWFDWALWLTLPFFLLCTYLLSVIFLDRLEVSPKVHGDFVFRTQQ